MLGRVRDFATDREHGTVHNLVPKGWRSAARRHPWWRVYAASSFAYSAAGLVLLAGLVRTPGRAVYAGEWLEGLAWIWQGCASYTCDVVDFGVPSASHPIDRVSAVLLIAQQLGKHAYFGHAWRGTLGSPLTLCLAALVLCGGIAWRMACDACARRDLAGYLAAHAAWHLVWPAGAVLFFTCRFWL